MLAGTGKFDSETVLPLSELEANYNALPKNVPAVMARKSDTEHPDMLWQSDSYVTAWLMYWLKDDSYARNAFWGDHAEIGTNEHWQDFSSK